MTAKRWATLAVTDCGDPTTHPPGEELAERMAVRLGPSFEVDIWRDVGWSIESVSSTGPVTIVLSVADAKSTNDSTWLVLCEGCGAELLERIDAILHQEGQVVRWYPKGWSGSWDDPTTEHP